MPPLEGKGVPPSHAPTGARAEWTGLGSVDRALRRQGGQYPLRQVPPPRPKFGRGASFLARLRPLLNSDKGIAPLDVHIQVSPHGIGPHKRTIDRFGHIGIPIHRAVVEGDFEHHRLGVIPHLSDTARLHRHSLHALTAQTSQRGLACGDDAPASPASSKLRLGRALHSTLPPRNSRSWRFVEHATLEPKEAALIQALADEFGNGLINA